jgi:hypothetical protein
MWVCLSNGVDPDRDRALTRDFLKTIRTRERIWGDAEKLPEQTTAVISMLAIDVGAPRNKFVEGLGLRSIFLILTVPARLNIQSELCKHGNPNVCVAKS